MIKPRNNDRICPTCNRNVHGRSDKKFCQIKCKNIHHKLARIQSLEIQHLSNKRIKRNFIVLLGLFGIDTHRMKIHRNILFQYGFDIHACIDEVQQHGKQVFKIMQFEFKILPNGILEINRRERPTFYIQEFLDKWKLELIGTSGENWKKKLGGLAVYFWKEIYNQENQITAKPFINKR